MLNCSASGKKRGGDVHVRKAKSLLGFTVLLRPLFFQNLLFLCSIKLFICKHRIRFAAMLADGITIGYCTTIEL